MNKRIKKLIALLIVSIIGITGATCLLMTGCSLSNKSNQIIEELYHDQGYVYMSETSPTDKDAVTYRLRAVKGNVTTAWLCFTMDVKETDASKCKYNKVEMHLEWGR